MVLCCGVYSTMLRTFNPSDRASDSSDLISAINGSRSLVAEMKSKVRSTVLRTPLHNTTRSQKMLH
ncbi:hypothetical protein RHMOL_Rhmol02G0142400 [Rhododendron molle]|uniref:Uncharacterized protein n=1 Tax=Rhododendron molle TaxID=49168 RepID=A0ACC0PRE4_RHOML|nr:hypothetical protein RHMOL_Rhmol02G0142400 [Rhododendron molle]